MLKSMKAINLPISGKLGEGKFVKIDFEDFIWAARYKWYLCGNYVYRYNYTNGKQTTVYLHREVSKAPIGVDVDHIDANPLNCTKENLRLVSKEVNSHIVSRKSKLGYRGIHKTKSGKFFVRINVNGKAITSKCFSDINDAIRQYNTLATLYYGSYAKLNEVVENIQGDTL